MPKQSSLSALMTSSPPSWVMKTPCFQRLRPPNSRSPLHYATLVLCLIPSAVHSVHPAKCIQDPGHISAPAPETTLVLATVLSLQGPHERFTWFHPHPLPAPFSVLHSQYRAKVTIWQLRLCYANSHHQHWDNTAALTYRIKARIP